MRTLVLVALGGSCGAAARYALTRIISDTVIHHYPWATLAINLTGCFFIGLFFELFEEAVIPETMRAFITVGFLGAYTTFSTYSLETTQLFRGGHLKSGMFNILASNVLGILFVFAGFYTGKCILKFLK